MARRALQLAALLAALGLLGGAGARRCADGPLGPLPGGSFAGGEVASGGPDPARLAETEVVELELGQPARSVLTAVVVLEGEAFIPTTWAPLKRWDGVVEGRPEVRVRVGEEIYEARLELVTDDPLRDRLFAAAQRKYGAGAFFADPLARFTRFFRWRPG